MLLPLGPSLLLLIGMSVGCAHGGGAGDHPSSIEPDPDAEIARLRHQNATLRKALKNAEERVRLAEYSSTDVANALPEGRALPIIKLEPKGGEAGRRHRESVSLPEVPNSGFVDDASHGQAWEATTVLATVVRGSEDGAEHELADRSAVSRTGSGEEKTRRFRLVGSRLVAETKRQRSRPKRTVSKRRKSTIVSEYDHAMKIYRSGQFGEAERGFEQFVRAHPSHDYADNALYWKGEAAYDQGHFSDALAAFTEVVERYGGGNKGADALLKIGLCYGRLGDAANARDVLSQLISAYPNARATGIARAKLDDLSEGQP